MDQQPETVLRERVIAMLLGLAGLSCFTLSIAETPWNSLKPVQILLAVVFTGTVILADQYPIHLARGTKAALTSLPIYLGAVLLAAPLAIIVAGGGMLSSNLMVRNKRGLLPRDIISNACQWMVIAFLAYQVNHLTIPSLDWHTGRILLLVAGAFISLIADFSIFSLINAFVLKEPFTHTLKTTFREGIGVEGIQYSTAILGALAINESIWALPLLIIPAITAYTSFKNIKEVRYETLQFLEDMADTVDLRDIYTGGHSRRVADHVHQILFQLKIFGPEAVIIETAARLHDIGKIGIPDNVLQKPSKLSPEEKTIMQTHSEMGAKLISKYKDFTRGALMIKYHHENWNGHGYPGRLKEYEIPFGSRVIAVADAFDAMTSDRPYRKALSTKHAVQILLEGRGKQWDDQVVNALVESISGLLNDSNNTSLSEAEISLALSNTISTFPLV